MNKIYAFLDIDDTLIYSDRYDIGDDKICVEKYKNFRSYMTKYSYEKINELSDNPNIEIIPITTRTKEQYDRIDFPKFNNVIMENGAIIDSTIIDNREWYEKSRRLSEKYKDNFLDIITFVESYYKLKFPINFVDDFFIVMRGTYAEFIMKYIPTNIGLKCIQNNSKVYIIPEYLTKVNAIKRFKKYIENINNKEFNNVVVSAGDNVFFDYCMADESTDFIYSFEGNIYSDVILKNLVERVGI